MDKFSLFFGSTSTIGSNPTYGVSRKKMSLQRGCESQTAGNDQGTLAKKKF